MFKLKNIVHVLFFVAPFFFVFSSFVPMNNYWQILYIGKHAVILMVLVIILFVYPKQIKGFRNIQIAITIFLIYIFYNLIINSNHSFASFYYIYSAFALFLISTKIPFIDKKMNLIKILYYGLVFSLSIAILYSLLWGEELYKLTYTYKGMRLRWYFDFHNPSYLASMLLLIGIIQIYHRKNSNISRFHFYTLFPITVVLIVLTDSRNSMISLILFYIFLNLKKIKRVTKIVLILAIPFIVYFLFFEYDTINGLSSSRLTVWVDTLNHNMKDFSFFRTMFGTGLGNAEEIGFIKTFDANVDVYKDVFHADNFYLETFIQFGLVGAIILFSLLVVIYRQINKFTMTKSQKIILNSIFFVILFFGFFNSSFIAVGSLLSIGLWIILWETYFNTIKINYINNKKTLNNNT